MGFKEFIQNLGNKSRERKELLRQVDNEVRVQKIIEDRQKSANERELERFLKEEREEAIKEELNVHRKIRDEEIKFGHNPLNTKNIMKSQWEVLKEKNQFNKRSNMFNQEATVMRNNRNLLRNNRRLIK